MSMSAPSHLTDAMKAGGQQFQVGEKVVSLYSGAVHYWRLDRDKWDEILDKVIGMGFNAITSYIPWEIHEIKPGEFDFGNILLLPPAAKLSGVQKLLSPCIESTKVPGPDSIIRTTFLLNHFKFLIRTSTSGIVFMMFSRALVSVSP